MEIPPPFVSCGLCFTTQLSRVSVFQTGAFSAGLCISKARSSADCSIVHQDQDVSCSTEEEPIWAAKWSVCGAETGRVLGAQSLRQRGSEKTAKGKCLWQQTTEEESSSEEGNLGEESCSGEERGEGAQRRQECGLAAYEALRNRNVAKVQEKLRVLLGQKREIFGGSHVVSRARKSKFTSESSLQVPTQRSSRLAQFPAKSMAEGTENAVESMQRSTCASSQERQGDEPFPVVVGASATKPAGETTEIRKRQSATSPGKAPVEKCPRVDASQPQDTKGGGGH